MKLRKRVVLVAAVGILIIGLAGSSALAQERPRSVVSTNPIGVVELENPAKQMWIGLDTVFIGRLTRDKDGNLDSILGMSGGLGIAYRRYFRKPEQFRALHPYWEVGTMVLLWPYGTLGVTYPIPLGDEEEKIRSLFCIGLYVGLLIPFPFAGIGLSAAF